MLAHWAAGKPAPTQADTAPGPKSAVVPSNDAIPAVEMAPPFRILGRCCVSLPVPKKRPLAKPAVPVENGYGRPDCSCPTQLRLRLLVNKRATGLSVTLPESSTTLKLAACRMSLKAGPNSGRIFT